MRRNNFKYGLLLVLITASVTASAKEFLIGYKNQMNGSYFTSNIEVKKIFTTLDIVAVEANDIRDFDYLKLDPNISFIEASIEFEAPKKFISKPYPTFKKRSKLNQAPIKPVGIDLVKADKVWEDGNEGQGIRVLVLDTGIDEDHPAIIANIEKAKNFLTNDESAYEDTNGHGTHVAGTIAGSRTLLGVAPKVKILAGKVCDGGCGSMAILSGVEWGIKEKVDVMNLSLGGPFASAYAQRVYAKAEANNIVVVAASGNDGKLVDSYPASYNEVLSVGAVDAKLNIASFSNWSSNLDVVAPGVEVYSSVPQGTGRAASAAVTTSNSSIKLKVNPMTGSGVDFLSNIEVVDAKLGKPSDFENIDVKGKVALIQRGELTFKEKHDNAIAAGAVAVMVYNNVDEDLSATLGEDENSKYIAVSMDMKSGDNLAALLKTEAIVVTLAVEATDYQNNNGTSMASPHVAGVAALIRATNPKLTAKEVKSLLKSTATQTSNPSPEKYGKGLVDALKASNKARSL